jgi:signal transduction histidine kinase
MKRSLEDQGQMAAIAVIVIGYVVTFIFAFTETVFPYTAWQIVVGISMGFLYFLSEINGDRYFDKYDSPLSTGVYFIAQVAIILIAQFTLSSGLIWLVALPLVGSAVERLPHTPWRYAVYSTPIIGIVVPAVLDGNENWGLMMSVSLSAGAAILFVIVFTKLRLNEHVAREKAEKLSDELEAANRQLSAYAIQAEELATTQERNRLAREIHDNLGHYLTVVNVQIEAARAVMATNPAKAQEAMAKAQELTQKGLTAVRQSVRELRESPLENRPLPDAVAALVAETQRAGIATELNVVGDQRPLSANTDLTLYRVAQEGLTNARKHAQATQVQVILDYARSDNVQLSVQDNGAGTSETSSSGFGLIGIRERITQLGGTMQVDRLPQQGFALTVTVPG